MLRYADRSPLKRSGVGHGRAGARGDHHGQPVRLGDDAACGRDPRRARRRLRGAHRLGAPHARPALRLRQGRQGGRRQDCHRRRRGRRPSSRHDRRHDAAAGARRADRIEGAVGRGQPLFDRPDAGRRAGRDACHRQGRGDQRRAPRRGRAGARRPGPRRPARRLASPAERGRGRAAGGRSPGVIDPRGTLGIVGGGQLGRMIALAAARYGLSTHVYGPEPDSPAFAVACRHTRKAYDDEAALLAFADTVDVITYEFENVPRRTAEILSRRKPLRPGVEALATTQDRFAEKSFVAALGIPTAPFRAVGSEADLADALEEVGRPAVLKTRRFGYDGKGQVMIKPETAAEDAWRTLRGAPCILEGFVAFEREVSVVAARTADGGFAAYDLCDNTHRDHILNVTRVPAGVSSDTEREAIAITERIAEALDYVGVLAVEMFVVRDGGEEAVVVNEIAPRVHNSGHWTIEGAVTSQFEQHVRAVCGWPLGSVRRTGRVEMRNLIGGDVATWQGILAEPGAHLHLYGKSEARPGRKMGHVTRILGHEH